MILQLYFVLLRKINQMKKSMFPREFVEWCLLDVGKEYKSYNSNELHYYTIPKTEEIWFESIDEIYYYWMLNVHKPNKPLTHDEAMDLESKMGF